MGISLYGLTPATTYDALIKTGDNEPLTASLKVLSDGVGTNLPMEASTTGINFTGALQQSGVAVPTASQVAAKQDTLVSGTNIKTINGTSVLGSGNIVTPTTSPSGVAGAIQFSNGSAFASDASNLFWDDANNRLGVGTNAPGVTLEVNGPIYANAAKTNTILGQGFITTPGTFWQIRQSTSNDISFDTFNGGTPLSALFLKQSGGSIGINTVTPTAQLHIKGSGSTSATTSLLVQNSAGSTALQVTDDQVIKGFAGTSLRYQFGNAQPGISTRNGALAIGLIDGGFTQGLRLDVQGSGKSYIDGWATFDLIIGQGGSPVVIGTDSSNASAQLSVNSTTKGFLPPRMTTTQKNAIATPAAGLVVYDNTTNKLQCYNGSTWNDLF